MDAKAYYPMDPLWTDFKLPTKSTCNDNFGPNNDSDFVRAI